MNKKQILEGIGKGILGFFIGGFLGVVLSMILFIPLITFMGFEWTMDFMFSSAHALVFRVLTTIGGIIGIIVGVFQEE